MAETQSTPTSNTEKAVAAVAVIAGIGGIIWGISSLAKDKASKVTVVLSPTSGAVGTVVSVTGTGWVDSETITSVIIGGIDTYNTLSVDSSGALSGSFTIPTLPGGNTTVLILGAKSTYTGTFLVVTAAMLAGFIILSSATLTVAHTTANPVGWLPLANFSLVVAHTTAEPVGWVGIANFSQIITHITPNPVGWLPLASISLSVAHSVVLTNPTISLTNNKLNQGDTLWYSLSGFAHGIQVTMSVSGYAIVVTTDVNGNYGPVNFPPTSSLAVGTYTLTATYGNGQSVTATFTVLAPMVTVNITDDGSGRGFVLITNATTGVTVFTGSQVPEGTALKAEAFVYNPANSMFNGWTGYSGSGDPIYPVANTNLNIVANFKAQDIITPPPNGVLVPGTLGDGNTWYYLTWPDNSSGWFDLAWVQGAIWYGDNNWSLAQGPYASGTTVTL